MNGIRIRGGRIIDPVRGRDGVGELLVWDGRIVPALPEGAADVEEIDAAGLIVTPGWIDAHLHIYPLLPSGVPAEAVCFAGGVTTAADAGSAGCATYPLYRPFLQMAKLRTRAFLNVATAGIISHPLPENVDPAAMDPARIRDTVQACPELVGLKVRISREIVGELGLKPLEACLRIAEGLGLPVMVHPTDPPCPMEQILERLRPGDILSHVYHNIGSTILDAGGHVSPAVWRARERGVLFDAANDRRHFGFSTAIPALEDGFYPDILSSDLTAMDMYRHPTVFSLPTLVSKYWNLGMDLPWILERVIRVPARVLGLPEDTAALDAGSEADIAVFRPEEREILFGDRGPGDPDGRFLRGTKLLRPLLTVRRGEIVYRDLDL